MPPIRTPSFNLLFFSISLLFSIFQHRLASQLLEKQYIASAETALGVLTGYPHWRVFQNRILGPYIVQWLANATSDFMLAYFLFGVLALAVAGYLAWHLGCQLKGAAFGVLSFFLFQSAFSVALDKNWLYAWDYIDLIIFFLFAIFVMAEKRWPWFLALFAAAILNRESAQFIALWLIVDPLVRKTIAAIKNSSAKFDWQSLVVGVGCLLFSIWAIEALRQALLVEEVGFKAFGLPRTIEFGPYFHLKLFNNLDLFKTAIFGPRDLFKLVPLLLLFSFALVAMLAAVRLSGKFVSLAVLQFGMLTAILFVAYMPEVRVYFQMIPFLVLGVTALAAHHEGFRAPLGAVVAHG